ncbi:pregnancy-specific glycoprotein 22-like [Microtus pennsylvanicus]|uniref:pregnancy-specific glycoprotein 22-like n=1 Tax=Microtus pennsylvanicus TaxID=10058 RepID=UPI003F6BBE31
MESSVLFCKRCTPWQRLLLTAFLLTFWHLSTTAFVTTVSVPSRVAEGNDVLFLVHNLPEKFKTVAWFRGSSDTIAKYELPDNLNRPGLVHSGRETIFHNGSMLLAKVNLKDTGFYTVRTYNIHGNVLSTTYTYLNVYASLWKCGLLDTPSQPTIEFVPPSVAEGGSVLLLVHNIPENSVGFAWFKRMAAFKNLLGIRRLPSRTPIVFGPAYSGRETLNSDGSLLLHSVSQKDRGLYILRILKSYGTTEDIQVQLHVDSSLSVFCNVFTSSRLMIQPVLHYFAEGEDVFLQVHNFPEEARMFSWHKSNNGSPARKLVEYNRVKSSISWEPAQRIKGTVYKTGSLQLLDVIESDAGMYTLEVLNKDSKIERANVEFYVKRFVAQPFVQITDTAVTGGTSVILTCVSPDTDVSIRWIFNNENLQLTEKMTLSPTKCGLRIDPVGSEHFGLYQFSLLTFWHLSTTARETTVSVPPLVAEGDDVLFLVRNLPKDIQSLAWFKGQGNTTEKIATYTLHNDLSRRGLAYSNRETIYHNGSMLFEKVILKDSGFYTLQTYNRHGKTVSTTSVILNVKVFWGPAYSGRETLNSDGSLLLHSVSQKDRGLYILRILRTDGKYEEAKVQLQVDSSLSTFCNALTPSQLMIQPVPRYAAEGEDVLLQVHNLPEEAQVFSWLKSNDGSPASKLVVNNRTKSSISWERAQRIRGKVYKTGSLLLQDIIESDAGMYTLEVLNKDSKIERANVEFYLKKPVTQPFVQITDTIVAGGASVIFTCISPDTDVSIRWIFNNSTLYLTERMTLSPTKCGLRISPVQGTDTGKYQCEVSNHFSSKISLPVSWP